MASSKGFGIFQFSNSRYASPQNVQESKGTTPSDKASDDFGVLTQLRDNNSGSSIHENVFSSVVSSTMEVPLPSFVFDVTSEDGIQLSVDLNSNPSDWMESMRAGVHISSGVHNLEANTSPQEVVQICRSSVEKEPNDFHLKDGSDLTMEMTRVIPRTDEPHGGEVPLSSSPRLKSFSFTVHNLEDLGQDQAVLSSRSGPDIDGQIHGPESVLRYEKIVATDPEKLVATEIKTGNFLAVPDDFKCVEAARHQGLKTGAGLYEEPSLLKSCGRNGSMKQNRFSGATSMEIQASDCSLVPHQEVGSSFQMHPAQSNYQSQYSSSSFSMGCPDNLRHKMEIECGRTSFTKSNREVSETQAQPSQSCSRTKSLFPFQNSHSLDFANFSNSFKTQNVGVMSSHKAGHKAIKLVKKDEYLDLCRSDRPFKLSVPTQSGVNHSILNYSDDFDKDICRSQTRTDESLDGLNLSTSYTTQKVGIINSHKAGQEAVELRMKDASLRCGSFDLAFPKQNGVNRCILDYSNNLDKGICKSQVRTGVGVLGVSKPGDARGSSECSDFRSSMEKPWKKARCSVSNRELDKKRHLSSVEKKSQSVSPGADILRAPKHFTKDARTSHRRSSRIVTQGQMKLKSNFRN